MSGTPRIVTLDIETSPALADVWALWDQNVSLSQLREVTAVISFAAKWHGEKHVEFRSDFHDGHEAMIRRAHELLDEADIVVHFNGSTFDMPHLNREFIQLGLPPYSPVAEIDLLRVVKSRFRFMTNKLQHVSTQLGLKGKLSHSGHEVWVACLAGDEKAWDTMRRYNKQDVVVTEELYDVLRPWIKTHPHMGLYGGEPECCPNCGSNDIQWRGVSRTVQGVYPRFQCKTCGKWGKSTKSIDRVTTRGIS